MKKIITFVLILVGVVCRVLRFVEVRVYKSSAGKARSSL